MASRHCCKGHKSTYSTDHERIFLLILLFYYGYGYGQVQAANSSDSFKWQIQEGMFKLNKNDTTVYK